MVCGKERENVMIFVRSCYFNINYSNRTFSGSCCLCGVGQCDSKLELGLFIPFNCESEKEVQVNTNMMLPQDELAFRF